MKAFVAAIFVAFLSTCAIAPVAASEKISEEMLAELNARVTAAQAMCDFTLFDTMQQLNTQGDEYVVLADPADVQKFVDEVAEPLTGGEWEHVTAVLIAKINGGVAFGLEVDECLTPPVMIPGMTVLPARMSGKMPDGSIHA